MIRDTKTMQQRTGYPDLCESNFRILGCILQLNNDRPFLVNRHIFESLTFCLRLVNWSWLVKLVSCPQKMCSGIWRIWKFYQLNLLKSLLSLSDSYSNTKYPSLSWLWNCMYKKSFWEKSHNLFRGNVNGLIRNSGHVRLLYSE